MARTPLNGGNAMTGVVVIAVLFKGLGSGQKHETEALCVRVDPAGALTPTTRVIVAGPFPLPLPPKKLPRSTVSVPEVAPAGGPAHGLPSAPQETSAVPSGICMVTCVCSAIVGFALRIDTSIR